MLPLLHHLPDRFRFFEPCAGAGLLIDHLATAGGMCVGACDIAPRRSGIEQRDALDLESIPPNALIITNPPHTREPMHALIAHFMTLAPTWLLINSDWKENVHAAPYLPHLVEYQPIGRLVWVNGTTMNGKANYGWYRFDRGMDSTSTAARTHATGDAKSCGETRPRRARWACRCKIGQFDALCCPQHRSEVNLRVTAKRATEALGTKDITMPTIEAPTWRVGDDFIVACPICDRIHVHGASNDNLPTWRVPHCIGPVAVSSYRLVPARRPPLSRQEIACTKSPRQ